MSSSKCLTHIGRAASMLWYGILETLGSLLPQEMITKFECKVFASSCHVYHEHTNYETAGGSLCQRITRPGRSLMAMVISISPGFVT